MSEIINANENQDKKLNLKEISAFEDNIECFTINAEEAAKILGVNRSRLSQLTSKGALTFEKRKIETRNRLFYKLSDLLNHQRSQLQNNQNYNFTSTTSNTNSYETQELTECVTPFSLEEEKTYIKAMFSKKNSLNKNNFSKHKLHSAKSIYLAEKNNNEHLLLKEDINFIKEKLKQQEKYFEKIKKEFSKNEKYILKHLKCNNNFILNIQNKILFLKNEINDLKENNRIQIHKKTRDNSSKINALWKKKKAKFSKKLTTGC